MRAGVYFGRSKKVGSEPHVGLRTPRGTPDREEALETAFIHGLPETIVQLVW